MSRPRLVFFLACALAGMSCTSPSSAPRLNVVLTFDASVSDQALATVIAFVVEASGDESGTFVIPLSGRAAMRTERFAYVPASTTHNIGLTLVADDGQGRVVAEGTLAPAAVNGATSVSIAMSVPSSSGDMMLADLAQPPGPDLSGDDFAVHLVSPMPVGSVVQMTSTSGSVSVSPPVGTRQGTVLIALIAVTDPNGQTGLITITPPITWTVLANTSDNLVPSATASWYWKYASTTEGTISFGFPGGDSALLSVIGFNGTNSQISDPFEGTNTIDEGVSVNPTIPAIENGSDDGVLIGCMVAPDDFLETFGTPEGYALLQGSGALWAELPFTPHGNFSASSVSTANSVRVLAMTTSLRSL